MQAQMPQMIFTPQNRSGKGPTALQMSGRMLMDGSSSQQQIMMHDKKKSQSQGSVTYTRKGA